MPHPLNHVAVIGAGTMGAAIAAHIANAGLPVLLLDVPPTDLTPEEEAAGLTPDSPAVRSRLVQAGFERMRRARPAALMSDAAAQRVSLGNTADDFHKLAAADWIIEAIVEQPHPKMTLFEQIDAVRKPGSIVTTNTSGLPVGGLSAGRSPDFRRHFFGAHFFNPPRYMKLLEIISTPAADPAAVQTIVNFAETRLGKGIVRCKDTPNFIGNRLFSIGNCFAVQHALESGLGVETVDALTGPLLGRPKTATFRLLDLVGIDVAAFIAKNLYGLIPHDSYRDLLRAPQLESLFAEMVSRGWLGNKRGQGFYKQDKTADGRRVFKILNPATFEYQLPQKPRFAAADAVAGIPETGKRLAALFADEWASDPAARYVWALVSTELAYAAAVSPEIAFDLKSVDDAFRWGFNFELGPFQLWDALGVAQTAAKMEADGRTVAGWVKAMLAAGCDTFYRTDESGRVTGFFDWDTHRYRNLTPAPRRVTAAGLRAQQRPIAQNAGASLLNMGDGVLLLEFHSKMNTLDEAVIEMMAEARRVLAEDDSVVGLVVGNDGENFCAGANIAVVAGAAEQGQLEQIRAAVTSLQNTLTAFRYSPKPVVTAVHNRALGGGAEVVIGGWRAVAHAESYIGLVEPGVGLVPAAGGVTALVRRILSAAMRVPHTDPLPAAQQILQTIGTAKVGASAAESRALGYLRDTDRVVMNRDHLLFAAKQEALSLAAIGDGPPAPVPLFAGGRDLLAALESGVWMMQQAGFISAHDALIGRKLAFIIAGGDLSAPQWVDEQHFLNLEVDAFIELAATEKTQARIRHMLKTGKPLRN